MLAELPGVSRLELRDYLDVLRRRKWIIIVTLLVLVATAVGLAQSKTKIYTASASFVLQGDPTANGARPDDVAIATEVRVLESDAVRAIVEKKLPGAGGVAARQEGANTTIIVVTANDSDPARAAQVANTYVNSYIEYRRNQDLQTVAATRAQLQARIDDLNRQINDNTAKLRNEQGDIVRRGGPTLDADLAAVQGKYQPLISAYSTQSIVLQDQLRTILAQSTNPGGVAQVIDPASAPSVPSSPNPTRDGLMAFGAGLLLGIALAFIFEFLDNTIKVREDVEQATGPAIPVLGVIPLLKGWRYKRHPHVVTLTSANLPVTEAYRSFAANVQFLTAEEHVASLLVSSASANEGKTTTIANLAVVLARTGRNVVLVDADLRRPRVHEMFGMSNDVGLTSVMLADAPLASVIQDVPGVDRLRVVSAGPIPPYPAELLSSPRFHDVLEALKVDRTIVLIDSPPLLPFADGAVMARSVDGAIVVVAAGKCTRKQFRVAVQHLTRLSVPHVGTLLNRGSQADLPGSGYDYDGGGGRRRLRSSRESKREEIGV